MDFLVDTPKQTNARTAWEKNALQNKERVRAAVQAMLANKTIPSFYSVARMACIARSTLYRRRELRELVEQGREDARIMRFAEEAGSFSEEYKPHQSFEEVELGWGLIRKLMRKAGLSFCSEPATFVYAVISCANRS